MTTRLNWSENAHNDLEFLARCFPRLRDRCRLIQMVMMGLGVRAAAREVGRTYRWARRWVNVYLAEGIRGIDLTIQRGMRLSDLL